MHVWILLEDLFGLLGYLVALGLFDVKFAHCIMVFLLDLNLVLLVLLPSYHHLRM